MTAKVEVVDGMSVVRGIPLTEEPGIGALTLAGLIREVCEAHGPREALVLHLDGEVIRWTYAELWDKCMAVARSLVACGAGKGTRVGVIATNRPEFLSNVFGAALAGCVPTPISTFFTPAELDEVLTLSGVSILLLERKVLKKDYGEMLIGLEPAFAGGSPGTVRSTRYPFLTHVAFIDSDETQGGIEGTAAFLARGEQVDPALVAARAEQVSPADPGILLFSSGSTGKVKGVLSANRSACLQAWRWAQWYDLDEAPRTWAANGFFWSGNFCQGMGATLAAGGVLVLQRWFDAEEALSLMELEKVTMPVAWPHQWAQLEAAPNYASVDLSSFKYVDKRTTLARHPTVHSTWCQPESAYGNTETFTLITVYPANTPEEETRGSHGLPTAGSIIKIVEPLTGATVPVGERGEIAVKGPTLMLGYLGKPLSESVDDEGFLRTSDGGYVDAEGRLYWEGRLNDIIKTGGANVSPLEIDAVIRECPGVKISQTVGVPDDLLGELVVSCIVPHEGASLDDAAIRNFAKEKLASYKLPRRVLFVEESDLKTTGSAKIKTADLRKLAAERLEAMDAAAG
ncbi:class I adenylate-forming enzyme family protein [Novosphingobium album (ex Hu et al. 2023)]|uniref:Acyl--CoA ligase n=1 Tax=Novosphingobium album (ex Hu et al. 2023) TaxID=2930093 RepID=A0ABT0AXU5_9SPHN|nr:class I adenylate-forming enzyme family protein [Novosphingobium album (ex Hu et al. 2023)]MCJ2177534.1 acyl--CoA ligase [Novosphingobium album (ex Hu et al. 2023)]